MQLADARPFQNQLCHNEIERPFLCLGNDDFTRDHLDEDIPYNPDKINHGTNQLELNWIVQQIYLLTLRITYQESILSVLLKLVLSSKINISQIDKNFTLVIQP